MQSHDCGQETGTCHEAHGIRAHDANSRQDLMHLTPVY